MFTGIIEAVGEVVRMSPRSLEVACRLEGLGVGDSIAVSGACLTVASRRDGAFTADLSEETLARTGLGLLAPGSPVNLERPVAVDGRFGGHIVQGHVDGVGSITRIQRRAGSVEMWIDAPEAIRHYLAEKGSVAVDGVSLTVARLESDELSVALIPHTLESTTLGSLQAGSSVNIEVDVLAKYVERLLAHADRGEGR